MGMTYTRFKISNPATPRKFQEQKFLVDSGAIYTVAPGNILKKLGIKPHSRKVFTLANGETTERRIGDAIFEYRGHKAASPVIFGKAKDSNLLGTVTLESLGFILDPLQRELKTPPMNLVAFRQCGNIKALLSWLSQGKAA